MNKEEMMKKAEGAATPEELLAMAQEAGKEMTIEQAEEIFHRLHKSEGELADDELDNVAGGCGGSDSSSSSSDSSSSQSGSDSSRLSKC